MSRFRGRPSIAGCEIWVTRFVRWPAEFQAPHFDLPKKPDRRIPTFAIVIRHSQQPGRSSFEARACSENTFDSSPSGRRSKNMPSSCSWTPRGIGVGLSSSIRARLANAPSRDPSLPSTLDKRRRFRCVSSTARPSMISFSHALNVCSSAASSYTRSTAASHRLSPRAAKISRSLYPRSLCFPRTSRILATPSVGSSTNGQTARTRHRNAPPSPSSTAPSARRSRPRRRMLPSSATRRPPSAGAQLPRDTHAPPTAAASRSDPVPPPPNRPRQSPLTPWPVPRGRRWSPPLGSPAGAPRSSPSGRSPTAHVAPRPRLPASRRGRPRWLRRGTSTPRCVHAPQ